MIGTDKYLGTKLMLAKLRKQREERERSRELSKSISARSHQINKKIPSTSQRKLEKPMRKSMTFMKRSMTPRERSTTPSRRNPLLPETHDIEPPRGGKRYFFDDKSVERLKGKQRSTSNNSQTIIPAYKYDGKSSRKVYTNKADLRYDIRDINQKKKHYIKIPEQQKERENQKLKNYLKAQNIDVYEKKLPKKRITEVIDYGRKNYRPEESSYMNNYIKRSGYNVNAENQTVRRIDKMKQLLQKEAHFNINYNPVILRKQMRATTPDKRVPVHSKKMLSSKRLA